MTPEEFCESGTEYGEQAALFCWANCRETRERFPHFFNPTTKRVKMFAINNNAGVDGDQKTAAIRGARAKIAGVQAGVFDIFIPLPRHGCAGLFVEMKINPAHPINNGSLPDPKKPGKKRPRKKGVVSDEQEAFGLQVQADGFGSVVCEGWVAAAAVIAQYLS